MIGIYSITNTNNGKKYIGKSTNIELRLKTHFSALRNGSHASEYMQEDYSNGDIMESDIIKVCSKEELRNHESDAIYTEGVYKSLKNKVDVDSFLYNKVFPLRHNTVSRLKTPYDNMLVHLFPTSVYDDRTMVRSVAAVAKKYGLKIINVLNAAIHGHYIIYNAVYSPKSFSSISVSFTDEPKEASGKFYRADDQSFVFQ